MSPAIQITLFIAWVTAPVWIILLQGDTTKFYLTKDPELIRQRRRQLTVCYTALFANYFVIPWLFFHVFH